MNGSTARGRGAAQGAQCGRRDRSSPTSVLRNDARLRRDLRWRRRLLERVIACSSVAGRCPLSSALSAGLGRSREAGS